MRGDGDEPMRRRCQYLLVAEDIMKDERKIIEKVTGKKAKRNSAMGAFCEIQGTLSIKVVECPTRCNVAAL